MISFPEIKYVDILYEIFSENAQILRTKIFDKFRNSFT